MSPNWERCRVSVLIPVRNERESIQELLDSLCAQTRQPDEIVFCDGGSTDGTVDIIERHVANRLPIKLIRTGPALPGRGRNLAAHIARYDLIAFTDAGIRLDSRWLERLVGRFEGPCSPDVVYGGFEPVRGSFCQRCIGLAFVPPKDRHSGLRTPFLASMAMRSSIWATLGGFREDLQSGEDLLFMRSISATRLSVEYAPDAMVFWNPPKDFVETFRRFAAYSYSNIRAGLSREWQIPVLRIYLLMALLTTIVFWTPFGLLAPAGVMWVRAVKRVVREEGFPSVFNLALVTGVVASLVVIDLATLRGCWRWLIADWIPKLKLCLDLRTFHGNKPG